MGYSTIRADGYDIFIGDVFGRLAHWLEEYTYSQIIVFVDGNTVNFCYPLLKEVLPEKTPRISVIEIRSGEVHKNLSTCNYLWEKLTYIGADRHALIINLSGGVLMDMGGFVATTYKRGVQFVNLPTTLLSMVDASVGGKLGIDYNGLKNHLGLFATPQAVFINPVFLKTLPGRELKSGMAEVLKHGLIADKEYFTSVVRQIEAKEIDYSSLVERSVQIKNEIVQQDPHEKGLRKILNFGHTAGHAIESWSFDSGDRLLHGEAIALGMMVELLISVEYAGLDREEAAAVIRNLTDYFGSFSPGREAIRPIKEKMFHDKKNRNGKIRFTLLKEIGQPVYDVEVSEKDINETLETILCR